MYLVDPSGQFVDYYGQTKSDQNIYESIMFHMAKYHQLNKKGWL